MARHKWVRLREHVYICRTCGCGKVNDTRGGIWETTYHTPDGQSRVLSRTPECVVGERTERYLAAHALDIDLYDAMQPVRKSRATQG